MYWIIIWFLLIILLFFINMFIKNMRIYKNIRKITKTAKGENNENHFFTSKENFGEWDDNVFKSDFFDFSIELSKGFKVKHNDDYYRITKKAEGILYHLLKDDKELLEKQFNFKNNLGFMATKNFAEIMVQVNCETLPDNMIYDEYNNFIMQVMSKYPTGTLELLGKGTADFGNKTFSHLSYILSNHKYIDIYYFNKDNKVLSISITYSGNLTKEKFKILNNIKN